MKRFPVAIALAVALSACPRRTEPSRPTPLQPAAVAPVPVSRDISIRLVWPTDALTLSPGETDSWEVELSERHLASHVRVNSPLSATLEPLGFPPRINQITDGDRPDFQRFAGGSGPGEPLKLTLSVPAGAPAGKFTGEILVEDSGRKARLAFSVRVAPMEIRIREAIAGAAEPIENLPLGQLLASPGFQREGWATAEFEWGVVDTVAPPVHFGRFALRASSLWDLGRLESLGPLEDDSRFPGVTSQALVGPATRMKLLEFSHEHVDFVDLANFPASRGFSLPGDFALGIRGERVARISPDGTQALACNAAGKLTWHRNLDSKESPPAVTVLEAGVEDVWADAKFVNAVALFREPDGKSTLKTFLVSYPAGLRDLPGSLISIRTAWFSPESGLLLVAGPNPRGNSAAIYDVARGELKAALPESGWGRPLGFLRNSGLPTFDSSDGISEWDSHGGPPRRLGWTEVPPGFALPGTEVRCTIEGTVLKFARPK